MFVREGIKDRPTKQVYLSTDVHQNSEHHIALYFCKYIIEMDIGRSHLRKHAHYARADTIGIHRALG